MSRRSVPLGDASVGPKAERDRHTVLERACVRARLRTEVRAALRAANRSLAPSHGDGEVPRVGEALADCVRTLRSLGVSEREALSDVRTSVDEMDLARRSPVDRRSLLAEAQRRVRDLYDEARA